MRVSLKSVRAPLSASSLASRLTTVSLDLHEMHTCILVYFSKHVFVHIMRVSLVSTWLGIYIIMSNS